MTDNTSEITPIDEQDPSRDAGEPDNSPGSQLLRARENAGLSRRELSERLCMIGNKLELLETDQYDRLPSALYVRGYIRSACKELNIDSRPVLEAYSGYCTAEEESREIVAHISRGPDLLERRRGLSWLALLPLLLVGGVFWWLHGRDAAPPAFMADLQVFDGPAAPDNSAAAEAEPRQTAAAVEQPPLDNAETPSPEPGEEASPVETHQQSAGSEAAGEDTAAPAEETPAEATGEAAESRARSPEPPAAASGGELQLSFDEDAWVEVRDASGTVLLAKLKPAGSRAVLTGRPPFRLMLGNAAATQVRYRGQLIDSAPIGDRRTRRLTVGE